MFDSKTEMFFGGIALGNEDIVKKLKASGFKTVIQFLLGKTEEISRKSTIPYKDVLALRRVLLAQFEAFPRNGEDLYEDIVSSVAILSTGCESIDSLLDEGLYTSEVTEIAGPAGSGKTQICLSSAITVSLKTEQCVLYIDTGGGFDVDRLVEMLSSKDCTEQESHAVLKRIRCQNTFTVFQLLTELENLKSLLNQQHDPFYARLKLVIVDCVASVVSPLLGEQHTDGHGYMLHLSRLLRSLAVEYSLAVLITNNMVHGDHAALGRSWASVPHTRLLISRQGPENITAGKQGTENIARTITLVKNSRQAVGKSTNFIITESGVQSHQRKS